MGLIMMSFIVELNMLSFKDRTQILAVEYACFTLFYLISFLNFRMSFPVVIRVVFGFIIYLTALAYFSSDRVISYNYLAKFTFGLLSIVTGYNFFSRADDIKLLAKGAVILLIVGLLISFFNNYVQSGKSLYNNEFYGPSLATTYNTFALLVCLAISLSFFFSRREVIFTVFLSFLTVFLLLLVFKRSPILIIMLATITTMMFSSRFKSRSLNVRRSIVLLIVILLATFPLYKDQIYENISVRQDAFEARIEDQPRFRENVEVLTKISSSPLTLLFGSGEVFNSKGEAVQKERMLHTDYANILWGGGVIGFVVYFGIFFYLLKRFIREKRRNLRNQTRNNIAFAGIIIVQSYLVCAISQAWTSISVMSIVMLSCGAVLGHINMTLRKKTVPIRQTATPMDIKKTEGDGA